MKVFAGLIVAASAVSILSDFDYRILWDTVDNLFFKTVDRIRTDKWWPANTDAPHCGCQVILDPALYGGYINSTCTIRFPYADPINYGRSDQADPHFTSIASTYMVGRNRGLGPDGFKFTGFDEVSNPGVLDILVFYENPDCAREGRSVDEIPTLPQDEIWEVYNVSEAQGKAMCSYVLECEDNYEALSGVHLGNFNYDIARSVQTYTVPIYGLDKGLDATFPITDYYNQPNNCINPLAHHGHGTAEGCSKPPNATIPDSQCSNILTFYNNKGKNHLNKYEKNFFTSS